MHIRFVALLVTGLFVGIASPARADVTLFAGVNASPESRPVVGFAAGAGLAIFAFEGEYARTSDDLPAGAPALRTFMGNVLVQTPSIGGLQVYATAGAGFYRETFDQDAVTSAGTNVGGGAKVGLAGPLRLRLDYRVFMLAGSPIESTVQRFYAGLNLAF
jgi:hypothetical protein